MADAVGNTEGVECRDGGRSHGGKERVVRVDHVRQFLEVGRHADGLAGDSDDSGLSLVGDALDAHLRAVEVFLDQDLGALHSVAGGVGGEGVRGLQLVGGVDADDAYARGVRGGFEDDGEADAPGYIGRLMLGAHADGGS